MSELSPLIAKLADGNSLDFDEAKSAFNIIMSGDATPSQIGGFLMALRVRGETIDEISGAVSIMRSKMVTVDAPHDAMDIVGTGGDNSGTYNVSSATAFVVAACGVPVAKHGNRALSSKSGAADVLMALGINLELSPKQISHCIEKAGLGFMFAPAHHAAMKHVGPTRVELGIRTIFNILGPLSNPAGTKRQLIGVFAEKWILPIAETLNKLGSESVWVVHGSDGLDEITTTGSTKVAALENGSIRTFEINPEDIGISRVKPEDLKGGDPAHNAKAIEAIFAGEKNAFRDIVTLNAAASLVIAGKADNLQDGAELARRALDTGKAQEHLALLVEASNQ